MPTSMSVNERSSDEKSQDEVNTQAVERPVGPQLTRAQSISSYFTIAASAFGLVSDGYHNHLMTMANVVFQKLYPTEYTADVSTRVSNSLLVGAVIGQVIVGIMCDRVGRKAALLLTTAIIVVGATLGTAAHGARGSPSGLFWFLTFARGLTGIGVGGEYPASSTSAAEAANEKMVKYRGPVLIMVTNFVLSLGAPLAVLVFLIVLSAAGEQHLETIWRVCFGIGIALPLTVFYFRLRMLTTTLYKKGAIKRRVPYTLIFRRYWKAMIGSCGTWFLYDFIIYPNAIFSATIISNIVHHADIKQTAEWQLLLATISLPGVIVGAMLCNPFGRRNTMMLGFSGYLVFGLIIGIAYDKVTSITPLFVILYGLMQCFGNLGPGNITILVSAESYPTAIRGTCYGISAAVGKAGAAIGTEVFTPIQVHLGKKWTFIIAGICGTAGILLTYFFVPEKTCDDLADEDVKIMEYLSENGWTGEVGDDSDDDVSSIEKNKDEKSVAN